MAPSAARWPDSRSVAGREKVRRFVSDAEYARVLRLLDRWGMAGIMATRPVPILAEVMAIIAGTTPTVSGWQIRQITVASIAGSLPPAIAYAVAGHFAPATVGMVWVFSALMLMSAAMWWFDREAWRETDRLLFRKAQTASV